MGRANRIPSPSLPRSAYRGKRLLDLLCVSVFAAPAGLIGAVCATAVLLTSRGPALFRQERIGQGGRPFTILKFRTMINSDNPLYPEEDRITTVGRWLRRSSLDELPQLWNVVRGEMSVVGPRPTLAYQVDRYTLLQRGRLRFVLASLDLPRYAAVTASHGLSGSSLTLSTSSGSACDWTCASFLSLRSLCSNARASRATRETTRWLAWRTSGDTADAHQTRVSGGGRRGG